MKGIAEFINEAAARPLTFVQSWSSNAPLTADLGYINYDRIDTSLDVSFADELSPKFIKWYENNAKNLNCLTIYRNYRFGYFAVVGARQFADKGYPVFAEGLSLSDLEEWLKKNGKSTSTKVSKY